MGTNAPLPRRRRAVVAAATDERKVTVMWARIAAAIDREARRAPLGADRALAEEWARQLRARIEDP